jgi:adenylylsulfate kinase
VGKSLNIIWHNTSVTKQDRRKKNGHHSFVLWLTGLSGSGKSTIANLVAKLLFDRGMQVYVLDGDNIRHGLNRDLSFSEEDRKENIRRIGEVSKLFVDSGHIVLTAFISPYLDDRQMVRELMEEDEFIEIFVDCPLEECEKRDPKGLYRKARKGEILHFTGISAPYEKPVSPDLTIDTSRLTPEECAKQILLFLEKINFI